jgi:hypothetical protein
MSFEGNLNEILNGDITNDSSDILPTTTTRMKKKKKIKRKRKNLRIKLNLNHKNKYLSQRLSKSLNLTI